MKLKLTFAWMLVFAFSAMHTRGIAADSIPPELVGIWSDGKGYFLIDANGHGMLYGDAIGSLMVVKFDHQSNSIDMEFTGVGYRPHVFASYNPTEQTITAADGKSVLRRTETSVPPEWPKYIEMMSKAASTPR